MHYALLNNAFVKSYPPLGIDHKETHLKLASTIPRLWITERIWIILF